jgi:hypothetical protein
MALPSMIFCFIANIAFAAHHYVSPTGSASWANATVIDSPCSTAVAFANAAAGDTVYFRGGTYQVPAKNFSNSYHGYYGPARSGAAGNPITFMAYPGEKPVFKGTAGGTGDQPYYATIFGTNNQSFITFDGFAFQSDNGATMARVMVGCDHTDFNGNGNIIVRNCDFNGGDSVLPGTATDNEEGLRIEGNNHVLVKGNTFYNYRQISNNHNTSAIKTYADTFVTVENCEIFKSTVAIYYKSRTPKSITRNNFIHDNAQGIFLDPNMIVMNSDSVSIYNNVIINNTANGFEQTGGGADSGCHGNDYLIFNNTFYNNGARAFNVGYTAPGGHGARIFNNIICGGSGAYSLVTSDRFDFTQNRMIWRNYLQAVDHNEWGMPFKTIRIGDNGRNSNYNSLVTWQTSGQLENPFDAGCGPSQNPGCGDLSSDPLFSDGSGHFTQLADFALAANSPCKGAGRDGADIGADISLVGTGAGQAAIKKERTPHVAAIAAKIDIGISPGRPGVIDFTVVCERTGDFSLSVFSIAGKELWKAGFHSTALPRKITWNTAGTGNGTYVAVLARNIGLTTRRFAIVKYGVF